MESAPKRFLVETVGESNGEKQDLDENADPTHAAASSKFLLSSDLISIMGPIKLLVLFLVVHAV